MLNLTNNKPSQSTGVQANGRVLSFDGYSNNIVIVPCKTLRTFLYITMKYFRTNYGSSVTSCSLCLQRVRFEKIEILKQQNIKTSRHYLFLIKI